MKKTWSVLLISILMILTLLLSSCGDAKGEVVPSDPDRIRDVEEFGYENGIMYSKVADGEEGEQKDEKDEKQEEKDNRQMIIRNVVMRAETKDYDDVIASLRALTEEMDGYEETIKSTGRSIGSENLTRRNATIVVRIPAGNLDAFLGQVGNMVAVTDQNITATNVTVEYFDIQARLEVLEGERIAYQKILESSTSVYDALSIQKQLYDVIEEIEAAKSKIKTLESQVSYSTVTIYLSEVIEYTPVGSVKDTFGTRLGRAFKESWQDFAKGFENFIVWFVGAIPTFMVLGLIVAVILCAVLHPAKRRKHLAEEKAKAAKQEKSE